MKGKKKCQHCGKMFKLQGLGPHERFCTKRRDLDVVKEVNEAQETTKPQYFSQYEMEESYRKGKEEALKQEKSRDLQVKTDLIGACSHLTEAVAHLVADVIRQQQGR